MEEQGLKNQDLQQALNYKQPNVVAMMRTGSMRLPLNKVLIAAKLLKLDPVFLLSKVVAENDPELWDAIASVLSNHLVTENELALLNKVRHELNGHDVNLLLSPDFVEVLTPALKVSFSREQALTKATLKRLEK